MASYYPIILNAASKQLTELPAGDNLDLTNSNIVNVSNLSFTTNGGNIIGNVNYVNGVVSLGDVGNVKITGGTQNYFLQTDGAGNVTWAVPSLTTLANGTSNIFIAQNANVAFSFTGAANGTIINANGITVTGNVVANNFVGLLANGNANVSVTANSSVFVSANGQSNILSVSSNGAHATSRIQDDLIVSGNLTVQGNTSYVQSTTLSVQNPIIEEGGGPNGAPLTTNDGKDRGLLSHYYTTAPVDAFFGWKNANGEYIVASNANVANNIVTVNSLANLRASFLIGANGVSSQANVNAANWVLTVNANVTGNLYAGNLIGVHANGNSNISIPTANSNVSIAANGNIVANVVSSGDGNLRTTGVNVFGYLSTTGNLIAANINGALSNGISNVAIPTANGNVRLNANGNLVVNVISSGDGNLLATGANIFGFANVQGNLNAPNIVGVFANGNSNISIPNGNSNIVFSANGISNVVTIFANAASNALITNGNANVTGNLHVLSNSYLKVAGNTGSSTFFAGFKASNDSANFVANYNLTLPPTSGANNQWMMVDGSGNLRFSNTFVRFNETVVNPGTVSGTLSPDLNTGTIFRYTLNGGITINTLSNVANGSSAIIVFVQDGTGGRTATFGTSWKFAGGIRALSVAAGATDVMAVFYDGTNYLASLTRGYV